MGRCSRGQACTTLLHYKNLIIIVLVPLLLLPLPLAVNGSKQENDIAKCGYLLLLMGLYWCTECLPLGVTSLIPVFLIPTFGFMTTKEVCPLYFEEINMMLLGGLVVALAIEKCNLHKRIALNILLLIGVAPRWLMLGFMIPTWFLSMWISNTATSAMMMPIVLEVINQIGSVKDSDDMEMKPLEGGHVNLGASIDEPSSSYSGKGTLLHTPLFTMMNTGMLISIWGGYYDQRIAPMPPPDYDMVPTVSDQVDGAAVVVVGSHNAAVGSMETKTSSYPVSTGEGTTDSDSAAPEDEDKAKNAPRLAKALVISIAFAANSGGIGTLIGTTTNLICKKEADSIWKARLGRESPINFASWMAFGIPTSLINLAIIWFWLCIYFIGPRAVFGIGVKRNMEREEAIKNVIRKAKKDLGRISLAEIQVALVFFALVVLWFFRKPDFIPGWSSLFKDGYIADAVPAVFMALLCFALLTNYNCFVSKRDKPQSLMDWAMITEKFPWSVILLLGGGFALAEATKKSGLSEWIGDKLTVLDALPGPVIVIILTYLVTLLTQFTSNTASATLMMPIVSSMAIKLKYNPLYLMLPVTIGTQLAFMLPVATPPNAVAFTSGLITVMDMIKAGTILNILCTFVATLATHTWGQAMFNLSTLPWSDTVINATTAIPDLTTV